MQNNKENSLIVSYIETMRKLASGNMFQYYRYTRENQETGEDLKKFYKYQREYSLCAEKVEKIVQDMVAIVPKASIPLLKGSIGFEWGEDEKVSTEEILFVKHFIASQSNEDLLKWLQPNIIGINVHIGTRVNKSNVSIIK